MGKLEKTSKKSATSAAKTSKKNKTKASGSVGTSAEVSPKDQGKQKKK